MRGERRGHERRAVILPRSARARAIKNIHHLWRCRERTCVHMYNAATKNLAEWKKRRKASRKEGWTGGRSVRAEMRGAVVRRAGYHMARPRRDDAPRHTLVDGGPAVARGLREYARKDERASPRPWYSAGEGSLPLLAHAAHGMKTRLDLVSDVPAGPLTLDVSSMLLSLLVSVLASDISSRANHSKTLGNPRFHGENSRCARSYCLYDEERWRLAWVT